MKTKTLRFIIRPILIAAAVALFASIQTPAAAQSGFYLPGLTQAKLNNAASWADTLALDVPNHATAERVPGTMIFDTAGYEYWGWGDIWGDGRYFQNPYTGNYWRWGNHEEGVEHGAQTPTGWGYTGQMLVENGVTYTFGIQFWSALRVEIDGQTAVDYWPPWWGAYHVTQYYTATTTGWVDFKAWAYHNITEINSQWMGAGPPWNPPVQPGLTFTASNDPQGNWILMRDPDDMTLFRTKAPPFSIPPTVTLSGADFTLSATLDISEADIYALAGFKGEYTVTNLIRSAVVAPDTVSTNFTGLATNTMYTAAALAVADDGDTAVIASDIPFYTGEVWLELMLDAQEYGLVDGVVRVHRESTSVATRLPLAVNYTFNGITAQEGVNYVAPSGVVTIAAEEDYADIFITPIVTPGNVATTLAVALAPGLYYANAVSVEVAIEKIGLNPAYKTWVAEEDGLASDGGNWSPSGVPQAGDKIMLSIFSGANMEWDFDGGNNGLPDTVLSWTQDQYYTGTVTFPTTYTDSQSAFTNFSVAGNALLAGGIFKLKVSLLFLVNRQIIFVK